MSEGKEIIVAEHPKAWVVRMVEGRGLKVAEKTLYWWSVHLERFLKFCRSAGAESSEIPEVAARLFLESLPVGGSAQDFAREQARMALDVFIGEMVGWSWGEDRYGRVGPKFRLKATSAGLTTTERRGRREVEQPKVGPEGARRAGASESKDTDRGCWPKIELMEWIRHGSRTARRAIPCSQLSAYRKKYTSRFHQGLGWRFPPKLSEPSCHSLFCIILRENTIFENSF